MSNQLKEVDMKQQHVKYQEVIFNNIHLNPCIGCVHRGCCEVEAYTRPGEYCRRKQVIPEVVNAE